MVKNIINWTAGGFFRSIGRFLAFIGITLLIAFFLSSSDLKLPSFYKILGIEKVYASTISSSTDWLWQTCSYTGENCSWSSTGPLGSHYFTYSNGNYFKQGVVRSTINISANTQYKAVFRISSTPQLTSTINDGLSILLVGATSSNGTYTTEYFSNITSLSPSYISDSNITEITIFFTSATALTNIRFYFIYTDPIPNTYYNIRADSSYSTDTSSQDAINNQTDILVNNQNENTVNIINNNNENTEKIIESNKVCAIVDKNICSTDNSYLKITDGSIGSYNNSCISNYIKVNSNTEIISVSPLDASWGYGLCFYTINKTLISCVNAYVAEGSTLSVPNTASYFRTSIVKSSNRPTFKVCNNGNQAINDFLNDDDSSGDADDMAGFINDFDLAGSSNLSDLLLIPINFLENVFLNDSEGDLCATWRTKNICLPNGKLVWSKANSSSFKTFFNLFAGALLCYGILKMIIRSIDDALNPNDGLNLDLESLTGNGGMFGYQPKHQGYKPKHRG